MTNNYSFHEYIEDFEVKKAFYGYHHSDITGGSYMEDSHLEVLTPWSAPNGMNSPIQITTKYDRDLAAYSLGGLESFEIYSNKEEKYEAKLARRKLNKKVDGFCE